MGAAVPTCIDRVLADQTGAAGDTVSFAFMSIGEKPWLTCWHGSESIPLPVEAV